MKQILLALLIPFSQIAANISRNSTPSDTQNLHRYIWASYNHSGGKLDEAKKWYDSIFSTEKQPIFIYKGYLYFLKDTNKAEQIVALIPKLEAHKALVNDPSIQLLLVDALEKAGRQKEAIEKLIKANNEHKGHQELAFHTANLYIQRKEPKNALIVIDNFLKNCSNHPNNFIFYFLKGQMLVQLNQVNKAVTQIKQCLEMHPNFVKGWLFYAMLEEKNGNFDNAIKAYLNYLEINGGNKEIEHHIVQLLFKKNMAVQKSKTVSLEASALRHATHLFEQKRYQDALEFLQDHLNKVKTKNGHKLKIKSDKYNKTLKIVEHKIKDLLYSEKVRMFKSIYQQGWV